MKYSIYQGLITSGGNGDYYEVYSCNNKAELRKLFNMVKLDVKGWNWRPGSYLQTYMVNNLTDEIIVEYRVEY